MNSKQQLTRAQFAKSVLWLKGKKFSFDLHAPFEEIYNWPKTGLLLKTARQVGKSTMLAGSVVTDSMLNPNERTFYATTSEKQAREFARVKLNEFLARSPLVRKYLLNKHSYDVKDSLFDKNFANGSGLTVSYMKDNADRTRGYSADALLLDEIQDMDPNEIPVVLEILSASLNPKKLFAGTPKTIENPIEIMWQRSTQHEIFFKCSGCGAWNDLGYKNIGKVGPICSKCGKLLNMENFHLVPTSPNPDKAFYVGVRVPQPALKLHYGYENKWKDLLQKFEEYDEAKFNNEVLGISFSKGTRFITEEDILSSCRPGLHLITNPSKSSLRRNFQTIFAGIDWSGGGIDFSSKTVVTIYGELRGDSSYRGRGKIQLINYKIFPQQDPLKTIKDIKRMLVQYGVQIIGADAGEGALSNSYIADAFGPQMVIPFRYGKFDKVAKRSSDGWTVYIDKTSLVDDYFKTLKPGKVGEASRGGRFIFPNHKEIREPILHLLSEHEHITKNGYRIWQRGTGPDDFLHASIFAYSAYKVLIGEFKVY